MHNLLNIWLTKHSRLHSIAWCIWSHALLFFIFYINQKLPMKHYEPEKNQTKVYLGSSNIQPYREKLTHYCPVLVFYTPWKHQKTFRFSDVFRGYRKATPSCNGLIRRLVFNDFLLFFFSHRNPEFWNFNFLSVFLEVGKCQEYWKILLDFTW